MTALRNSEHGHYLKTNTFRTQQHLRSHCNGTEYNTESCQERKKIRNVKVKKKKKKELMKGKKELNKIILHCVTKSSIFRIVKNL